MITGSFLVSCVTVMCSQHLMVTARRFTVIIEEKLLLKLLSFFGYGQTEAGGSLVESHC